MGELAVGSISLDVRERTIPMLVPFVGVSIQTPPSIRAVWRLILAGSDREVHS